MAKRRLALPLCAVLAVSVAASRVASAMCGNGYIVATSPIPEAVVLWNRSPTHLDGFDFMVQAVAGPLGSCAVSMHINVPGIVYHYGGTVGDDLFTNIS